MEEALNSGEVQEETQVQMETAAPQAIPDQEASLQDSQAQDSSRSDQQDKSWVKKLRRDRDEAVRKSQLQEELIRQLMTAQQTQTPTQAKESALQRIKGQDYISANDFEEVLKEQKEEMKRELEELKKQSEQQKIATQVANLKKKYEDFDEVVNPDTLALLKETDPESAEAIDSIKDLHKAALMAYKAIKASDLLEKVPDARRSKEVEKKLEQNKKTIQSPQSFEKRPMAQAFRMPETKQEKQALYTEMMNLAQLAGGGY